MAKQHFNTKAQTKITHLNTIVFLLICLAILAVAIVYFIGFFKSTPVADPGISRSSEYIGLMALTALLCIEAFMIPFLPAAAIFFGLQRGRKKAYRENATFNGSLGITYFRDVLKGISPSTMSIVTDLEIEDNKDIAATLLRLYNKKLIRFEENRIVYTSNTPELDGGEQELMDMLSSGGITPSGISRWKTNRRRDAIGEGYVKENLRRVGGCSGCFGMGCLSMAAILACVIGISILAFSSEDYFNSIQPILDRLEVDPVILQSDIQPIVDVFLYGAGLLALIDIMVAFPCYSLFHFVAYSVVKTGSRLERTPKGDELAEKIAGLKRFIHEFSNLSEAVKEQVVLWDDFLVYAVVLEENQSIVKDISKRYGKVNLSSIMRSFS